MDGSNDARHQHVDNVVTDNGQHLLIGLELGSFRVVGRLDKVVVLRRNNNGVDAHGRAVVVVLNGNLALGIGTQVGHLLALATDVGQHLKDAVCQGERERHVVFGFIGGIAEHHALVASTLFHGVLTFHTAVDVGALLVDGAQHTARVALEHVFAFGVTNLLDYLAGNELEVNVCLGFHFAGQYHLSRGYKRFARHLRLRVVGQQFVKYSVRNLIGHFVWVSLGHRFGCKQVSHFNNN